LMVLPRSRKDEASAEETVDLTGKIVFDTLQLRKTYELTCPSASKFSEYKNLIETVATCVGDDDRLYLATEWREKTHCMLLATDEIEARLKCLAAKVEVRCTALPADTFEISHEFIRDVSEWEAIADLITECTKGMDRLYLSYDRRRRLACCVMLWSTDRPAETQLCLSEKNIRIKAAGQ